MTTLHEPDPVFLEHLAWQTRTRVRREQRFAEDSSGARAGWRGRLRTPVLVLASMLGGAASVVAADHIQGLRERELLLAGAGIRLDVAGLRLDQARSEAGESRQLREAGLVSDTETAAAEAEVARRESVVQALALEAAEIEASGLPPRDELSAPLVQGRDFVTERLQLALRAQQASLDLERERLARAETLHSSGYASQGEVEEARTCAAREESAAELLRRRLALRQEFLAGGSTARQAELLGLQAEARQRAAKARAEVDRARAALGRIELQVRAGLASSSELGQAQVDLRGAEAELRLAELELERIADRLGR